MAEDHVLEPPIALDLAADVADDAAEIGAKLLEGSVGTLELLGMGIALVLDERELADPRIGLTTVTSVMTRPIRSK